MLALPLNHRLLGDFGLDPKKTGIIIVDHGSRRAESNDLLLEVVAMFRRVSGLPIIEPAHMELAEPSIDAAFARCAEQGATTVIVFPYFLAPGRHVSEDIPQLAAKAAEAFPDIHHKVTAPIGLHDLMGEIMQQRIEQCLEKN